MLLWMWALFVRNSQTNSQSIYDFTHSQRSIDRIFRHADSIHACISIYSIYIDIYYVSVSYGNNLRLISIVAKNQSIFQAICCCCCNCYCYCSQNSVRFFPSSFVVENLICDLLQRELLCDLTKSFPHYNKYARSMAARFSITNTFAFEIFMMDSFSTGSRSDSLFFLSLFLSLRSFFLCICNCLFIIIIIIFIPLIGLNSQIIEMLLQMKKINRVITCN